MNYFRYLTLVCVVLSACGKENVNTSDDINTIPDEFQPYIAQFTEDATKYHKGLPPITNLTVVVIDFFPDHKTIATCKTNKIEKLITVSSLSWSTMSLLDKKLIMYHELGHCILFKPHKDGENANHRPISIMNTFMIGGKLFYAFEEEYLTDLFNT